MAVADPLLTLREYRNLAPWNLKDLTAVACGILECSLVRPTNASASTRPNERTIRFYVARGLVMPPDGRGTAAVYSYRHLLQILLIKLRQMEGATLEMIGSELNDLSGDVLERKVAEALGSSLPAPDDLSIASGESGARGRSGRVFGRQVELPEPPAREGSNGPSNWVRISVSPGLELHLLEDHPLSRDRERSAEIASAVRNALTRFLPNGR